MCVLLVEDEFLTRATTQLLLEDFGYEVLAADDGQAALTYLDEFPGRFSCLVTDYSMPGGVSGADIIRRMRATYPTIPIILATAVTDSVPPQWLDTHSVKLLAKPYDPELLAEMLPPVTRTARPRNAEKDGP